MSALLASLRRPVAVAGLVLAVVAVTLAAWWFTARSADSVATAATQQVVEVTSGSVDEVVSAEGTVAAAESASLSFSSAGTVTEVLVEAGDVVVAGQVLATLDSAELAAAVAEAQASLAEAEAKLADDEAAGASDAQIKADTSSLAVAQDRLAIAEADLAGATLVAGFDGTVATVGIVAGERLGNGWTGGTSATGSASGTGRSASTLGTGSSGLGAMGGDTSTTSTSAQIELVSTGRYQAELAVGTTDVELVAVGQEVSITEASSSSAAVGFPGGPAGGGGFPGGGTFPGGGAAAGPRCFPGAGGPDADAGGADAQGSEADGAPAAQAPAPAAATTTGTVVSVGRVADASSGVATYPVVVEFTDDAGELYVGSSVTAEIVVGQRTDVVQVASFAVTTVDGTSTVTVALDGTAEGRTEERRVTTGEASGATIEVTSGLEPGEQVVVSLPSFGGGGGPGGGGPGGGGRPGGGGGPGGAGGGFPGGGS